MEKSKINQKTSTDKELEDFMTQNANILYKKVSQDVGSRVNEINNDKKYTVDGKFTKHMLRSGMYKFNGLNTIKDKERTINGSRDWMLKLV